MPWERDAIYRLGEGETIRAWSNGSACYVEINGSYFHSLGSIDTIRNGAFWTKHLGSRENLERDIKRLVKGKPTLIQGNTPRPFDEDFDV